jgi:glycosyltransferase involved in cell wall biosynthesis
MGRVEVAVKTLWNQASYRALRALLQRERPAVVHFTNTFPLISPAAYYAARHEGVAVVQSLHNYRLLCPQGNLFRNQAPCEACLGRTLPWPALQHGCYRSDRLATGVVAGMTVLHRALGTWKKCVDQYVALSDFSARKFIAGGLPAEKITVKRNFMEPDPGVGPGGGGYAVFVGRLTPEKGLPTLLEAWEHVGQAMRLKVVGTGPMEEELRARAAQGAPIELLGFQPIDEVLRVVGEAACLVMPSRMYENCPKTVIEAFAVGTPVVASRLGAVEEMIAHEKNGLLVEPQSATDWARAIRQLVSAPAELQAMRQAARAEYERRYTAEENYQQLLGIYQQAQAVASVV